MGEPGKPLGCPHCGASHPEEVLLCPNTNRLLPLEGRLLDNRFRFTGKLGEGGMSTVWAAENVRVRKRVAIKIMHPEYARNPRTLHRFQNEATSAGRIGNPHICDILDLGESRLGPYIVMEMLIGQSFAELLEDQGRIDPPLATLIIREALKGLSAAHAVGIIHRDLKPENVFLHEPEPGRMLVKLMDFGISKFTEDPGGGRTGANVVMGTPEYMSPEQAAGAANVDARTDIWAMGVMLYRAISGVEPFRGKTMAGLLLALSTEDAPSLAQAVPGLPPGLVSTIERCLRKEADERYQTTGELYDALGPFQQAVAAGERPAAPVRTGRTMAVGLNSAAAAALAAGAPPGPAPATAAPATAAPPSGITTAPGTHPSASGEPRPTRPGASGHDPALADTGAFPMSAVSAASTSTPPAAARSKAGGAQTWSSELDPSMTAAEQSWSMGRPKFDGGDARPEGEGQRGGGWVGWVILLVFLVLIGGGVAWAYSVGHLDGLLGGGSEIVADSETAAASETGDLAGSETDAPIGADQTGSDATGAEAGSETGAETGDGDATTGDGTTTDDGADAGGSSETTTTGGGGGSTTPKPQLSKVFSAGRLYTPRARGPNGAWSVANSYCRKLKRQRKYGFTKWRMATAKEATAFRNSGVDKLLYWTKDVSGDQAKVVSMMGGQTLDKDRSQKAPRAFCVSTK